VAPATELLPDPQRTKIYQRRFTVWQGIEQALTPHWAALAGMNDD